MTARNQAGGHGSTKDEVIKKSGQPGREKLTERSMPCSGDHPSAIMSPMKQKPGKKNPTAAKILQATDELLVEGGYNGVSMSAVARRAGVNKALLFYYFGSKAQLVERVLERYYTAHLAALQEAFVEEGPLPQRLHNLVDAYLDFMEENLRYPRLVQQQMAGSDEHHDLIRRNLGPIFNWTRQSLTGLAPEIGPMAARHLFITFSGLVINYFTFAPVLGSLWGDDPMSPPELEERRFHVHWVVDAILEKLSSSEWQTVARRRGRAAGESDDRQAPEA